MKSGRSGSLLSVFMEDGGKSRLVSGSRRSSPALGSGKAFVHAHHLAAELGVGSRAPAAQLRPSGQGSVLLIKADARGPRRNRLVALRPIRPTSGDFGQATRVGGYLSERCVDPHLPGRGFVDMPDRAPLGVT